MQTVRVERSDDGVAVTEPHRNSIRPLPRKFISHPDADFFPAWSFTIAVNITSFHYFPLRWHSITRLAPFSWLFTSLALNFALFLYVSYLNIL